MTDVVMAAIAMDSVVGKGLPGLDETTTTLSKYKGSGEVRHLLC